MARSITFTWRGGTIFERLIDAAGHGDVVYALTGDPMVANAAVTTLLDRAKALGIELHPDVLPFSNIPAYLPPFLLRPDRAMTMRPAQVT